MPTAAYRRISQLLATMRPLSGQRLRLPTERVLSRNFGVARVTIRKALAVLESHGWVERRRRHGTYLLGPLHCEPINRAPEQAIRIGEMEPRLRDLSEWSQMETSQAKI